MNLKIKKPLNFEKYLKDSIPLVPHINFIKISRFIHISLKSNVHASQKSLVRCRCWYARKLKDELVDGKLNLCSFYWFLVFFCTNSFMCECMSNVKIVFNGHSDDSKIYFHFSPFFALNYVFTNGNMCYNSLYHLTSYPVHRWYAAEKFYIVC